MQHIYGLKSFRGGRRWTASHLVTRQLKKGSMLSCGGRDDWDVKPGSQLAGRLYPEYDRHRDDNTRHECKCSSKLDYTIIHDTSKERAQDRIGDADCHRFLLGLVQFDRQRGEWSTEKHIFSESTLVRPHEQLLCLCNLCKDNINTERRRSA